ncbi:SAM-dependent methyltransferase [Streptomyces albulus]|nr:SAM-dependent methyltransferase [Streptomyces noursei]
MTVYFIGAGPGAADLITLRGARTSPPAGLPLRGKPGAARTARRVLAGARLIDTAHLDLDAITAELVRAHEEGQDVARLHSGDPSVFSAVAEQMRRLDAAGCRTRSCPECPRSPRRPPRSSAN